MNASANVTVGVLGGMGPEATVDLMQRVIALTPASDDSDHIHMLVDNNPGVPSRIKAIIEKSGPSPAPALIAMAEGLVRQGADFLVMPCNTAHYYHGEVAAAVSVPFLNLMELVAERLKRDLPSLECVGLLGSSALPVVQLYEPHFASINAEVVYPEDARQEALMGLIRAVKAGDVDEDQRRAYAAAAADLEFAGAQCLLVACTELSALDAPPTTSLPVFDAAQILAEAIVQRAG